jgi:hypothetical protein
MHAQALIGKSTVIIREEESWKDRLQELVLSVKDLEVWVCICVCVRVVDREPSRAGMDYQGSRRVSVCLRICVCHIYIHIYTYIHMCVCVYIYIYIYMSMR